MWIYKKKETVKFKDENKKQKNQGGKYL